MAVKTGSGAQRQTAVAKSVSDLGALMSAKAEANTQPQPDIQVQAEVNVLPESNHNLTGVASVTKEADIQSTPATAQSEQTTKEETMPKNETTQAQAPAAQVPAADQAPAATAAPAEASTAAAPADATTATTAPTQTHGDLDKLLGEITAATSDDIKSAEGLVNYLQGRDGRFKTLVEITKDTVSRVDALEAKMAKVLAGGLTRTVKVETPDWKDQAIDGLVMGTAVGVGVLGVAYAFDALFGQPGAAESGVPAIQ